MRRQIMPPIVIAYCALLVGCGDPESASQGTVTVRDSLGTRIVEHDEPPESPAISLDLVWEHGHAPGDYEFQFVLLGALDSDGGAVVGDMLNQEVVAIASSGTDHLILARSGQGPTEVRRPRAIEAAGDHSFWVEDTGNAKLMLYEGSELVRSVSTQGNATVTRGMMPLGVDANGSLLMRTASYSTNFEQLWLDGSLTRFDPDAGTLDTVGTYPMTPKVPDTGVNPFTAYGVVTGAAGGFVHGRADVAELTWRSADGVIAQIVRWSPNVRYPTSEFWALFEARQRADLTRMNPGMSGDRIDDMVARYDVDESIPLPLFGPIYGADDGSVWLSEFVPRGTYATSYEILSAEGEWVGVADFARAFLVLDIRGQFVLGMVMDESDVQGLAVYRFEVGS